MRVVRFANNERTQSASSAQHCITVKAKLRSGARPSLLRLPLCCEFYSLHFYSLTTHSRHTTPARALTSRRGSLVFVFHKGPAATARAALVSLRGQEVRCVIRLFNTQTTFPRAISIRAAGPYVRVQTDALPDRLAVAEAKHEKHGGNCCSSTPCGSLASRDEKEEKSRHWSLVAPIRRWLASGLAARHRRLRLCPGLASAFY